VSSLMRSPTTFPSSTQTPEPLEVSAANDLAPRTAERLCPEVGDEVSSVLQMTPYRIW
jgi:hypothetical protein